MKVFLFTLSLLITVIFIADNAISATSDTLFDGCVNKKGHLRLLISSTDVCNQNESRVTFSAGSTYVKVLTEKTYWASCAEAEGNGFCSCARSQYSDDYPIEVGAVCPTGAVLKHLAPSPPYPMGSYGGAGAICIDLESREEIGPLWSTVICSLDTMNALP
jgi:hypothetical protein